MMLFNGMSVVMLCLPIGGHSISENYLCINELIKLLMQRVMVMGRRNICNQPWSGKEVPLKLLCAESYQ